MISNVPLVEVSSVTVDCSRSLPSKSLMLSPAVVFAIELSKLSLEMRKRSEPDLCYQLSVKDLVIALYLSPPSWMIRLAIDRLDVIL